MSQPNNPAYVNTLIVTGVASDAEFEVLTVEEKDIYEATMKKYLTDYKFDNISDLQDLDRLVALELLSYRYSAWLIKGFDYEGLQFAEKDVRDHKQKVDVEIRNLKKSLGMDRKNRFESEQQSVSEYISALHRRAREFGIHRDNQIAKAMDLFEDLKTMIGLYDRSDEEERRELGVDQEQIMEWIRNTAIPEYDAIDDAFRKNQRLWIQEVN